MKNIVREKWLRDVILRTGAGEVFLLSIAPALPDRDTVRSIIRD